MSDDLTIHPPDSILDSSALVGDLRRRFPGNDALYGDGPGNGNPDISDKIKARLTADHPEVAARVEFDPEYSGFFAYGTEDDLAVVVAVIDAMTTEPVAPTPVLTVSMRLGDSEFADDPGRSAADLLRKIADRIENGVTEGPIVGVNGSTVGTFEITGDL